MKIDLHIHTKERSVCGKSTDEEQIAAARAAGLDALVFTDHNRLLPADRRLELNARHAPFRIFGGVELNVEDEHVVVLGIQDERLVTGTWAYVELHAFVRQNGGFLFLAHPFRYHPHIGIDIENLPPDGIEVNSCSTPAAGAARIRELAARLGMALMSNSDSHSAEITGRYYNILADSSEDDRALAEALRRGFGIFPDLAHLPDFGGK